MELKLSEEQRMIIHNVRRFVREEIIPLERDLDPDAFELPVREQQRLTAMVKAMGLYQMGIPKQYGGPGVDMVTRTLAAEEMSQHRAGLYHPSYDVFGEEPPPPLFEATDYQQERYLLPLIRGEKRVFIGVTEPSGGSDPARAIQSKAVRDGDEWVINGSKMFNSWADRADFGLVFVRTNPKAGRQGISCFLVPTDTPGYVVARLEEKLGLHASDTAQIVFEDCRIPADHLIGAEGEGYRIALSNLEAGRIGIASQSVGMARAALEAALKYAHEREAFGKPIIEHQAVSFRLADMATKIEAARQLTWHAASLRDAGLPCLKEASMAKLFASEMAERVCSDAIQIHGGYGVVADFPVERIYRDVRVCQIYEGASDIQRLVIGRALLGAS